MFTDNQIKELSKPIDKNRVKTRDKAGMNLEYLETYDVINEANRLFNHYWSYSISRLEEVSRVTNQNSNHVITFSAIVKVKIFDSNGNFIEREDTGVGIGTARSIGDAIDNASKSSVSDALKRCLRTMGATFGNDLYSKSTTQTDNTPSNANVSTTAPQTNQYNVQQQGINQQHNHVQSQNYPQNHFNHTYDPYEYQSLYNIGLDVIEQQGFLLVTGDDIFSKKDSIKACGFRWDGKTKQWYKQLEQGAA